MAFSFLKRKKTPDEIVKQLAEDLEQLAVVTESASASGRLDKAREDVAKRVGQMKAIIWGEPDSRDVVDPAAVAELGRCLRSYEIMPLTLTHLRSVDFEVRKEIATAFRYVIHNDVAGIATEYMPAHMGILYQLCDGYTSPDIALVCGEMLRECMRWPDLNEAILYDVDGSLSPPLTNLLQTHVANPNFEVASDAFDTLTVILTTHKSAVFKALNPSPGPEGDPASAARYDEFFAMYNPLLGSENYVLKRQSLKLLSEFLLDRENFPIMMKYISDKNNLKLIMNTLRHRLPNVQFEAFHVFKVFVANPEKPSEINATLAMNKERLIQFLRDFQNEKNDEQFVEEKVMLIETLQRLPDMEPGHSHHHASSTFGSSGVSAAVAHEASAAGASAHA